MKYLIDASKFYLKQGEFAEIKITEAADFDLYGEPIKIQNPIVPMSRSKFNIGAVSK